jgi:sn-glycerol 3-phosphate transport system substrate-binding protein
MKARTILALTLAAAAVAVGACSSPKGTGGPPTGSGSATNVPPCPDAAALSNASGPVTVTFWYNETAASEQTLLGLVKSYNASQHKVKVVPQNQTTQSPNGVIAKYQGAIASKQLPDLVEFYDQEITPAVDTNTLLPAQSCLKQAGLDQLLPAVRSHYTLHGVYWPGYVGVSAPLMYFNAAAFTKAGLDPKNPPRTLDDVYAAAKKLKASGVPTPVSILSGTGAYASIMSWLAGADQTIVNHDDGRDGNPDASTYDNPATRKVYELLAKMKAEKLLAGYSNPDQLYALAKQTSAITFGDSEQVSGINAFLSQGAPPGLTFAYAPLPTVNPTGHASVQGPGFFVVKQAKPDVQAAAWDFLSYLRQKPQALQWLKGASYLPFEKPVADDPGVKAFFTGSDPVGQGVAPAWTELTNVDPAHTGPLPLIDVTKQIDGSIQALLFSGASPNAAIKQASSGITAVINTYYR